MVGVGKFYDKKPIIKDIYLSYFYGAKIGVLGLNGSGKSTLLRIIAGVDKEYVGETVLSPGYAIGYLEQEPQLDNSKTVREIVEEGVQETVDLLKEFDEINGKFAEPMDDDEMNALLERQGEVQEKLDAAGAWDLDARLEMAMGLGRRALPAGLTPGPHRGGRVTPPRRAVPSVAETARHSAAGRADQPFRRRIGRLARTALAEISRHGHRRHSRPLFS